MSQKLSQRYYILYFIYLLSIIGCVKGEDKKEFTSTSNASISNVSESRNFGYAVNFSSNSISMYSMSPATGVLTPLSPATIATGNNPQSIKTTPSGQFIYVANAGENSISMYSISSASGLLTALTPATVAAGRTPYNIVIPPSGTYAYVNNLNDNNISMYSINSTTGLLTPLSPATVASGMMPVDMIIDPLGKNLYALCKEDSISRYSDIFMYEINSGSGLLTPLPTATIAAGFFWMSNLSMDSTGRFIYSMDHTVHEESILMFVRDSTSGILSLNTKLSTSDKYYPNFFTMLPSAPYAYSAAVYPPKTKVLMFSVNSSGILNPLSPDFFDTGSWTSFDQFFFNKIIADPSSKFLYYVNLDENSISTLSVGLDGQLSQSSSVSAENKPISFTIVRLAQ